MPMNNAGLKLVLKLIVSGQKEWKKMRFGISVIYRDRRNHREDCYFCITPAYGFTNKPKHKIQYPYLDSTILPVPHSTELHVPVFIKFKDCDVLNYFLVS